MLRRLMKYEFLSTGRIFGLCYIGVLLAAVLVRILSEFAYNQSETMRELLPLPMADIFAALSAFLYFGMIVAVIVVTFVLILQRFYKNLLCEEGYLMHTLPVNAHQLIFSKLTAAVVWTVASTVVVMLSIVLLVATPGSMFDFLFAFGDFLQRFQQEAHFSFLVLCLEFFVVLVVAVAASILQIYAAIMLGHQAPKHRILLAVVAYFAIQMILSTASVFLLMGAFFVPSGVWDGLVAWMAGLGPVSAMQLSMLFMLVSNLVFAGIFYFMTEYLMRRHLNLE